MPGQRNSLKIGSPKPNWLAVAISVILFVCLGMVTIGLVYLRSPYLVETIPAGEGVFSTHPVWTFETADTIVARPVVQGSRVFIQTSQNLYALEATTGELAWSAESLGDPNDSKLFAYDDFVLASERRAPIATFTAGAGELLWRHSPQGDFQPTDPSAVTATLEYAPPNYTPVQSVTFARDIAYVTRFNWKLTAYDLERGQIIWEASLPGRTFATVVTDGDTLYVDTGRILKAYDATTGTVLWEQDVGEVIGKLVLDGSNLYMSCALLDNNCILSMDVETQALLWEVDYDTLGVPEIFHLSFNEGGLYGAGDSLVAIDAKNGNILWQSDLIGPLGPPTILDDKVYVKAEDSTLYAFDIKNGRLEGRLSMKSSLPLRQPRDSEEYGPVVVDDLLIVPLGGNRVYAYRT